MTYRPTILGCGFLLIALALAVCEVVGVLEFVREQHSSLYVVVGSCIIAAVTPGIPTIADWLARSRAFVWCLIAWLGFGVCVAIVMTAAVQRTGTAADTAQQSREQATLAKGIAETAEEDAKRDYAAAQEAALRECSVRGKKCMDAEAKASELRGKLATARAALVKAPAGQVDPLARRLAAVLPFLSEEQVRLLYPLLVPIALSILSALFFAGWSRLDFSGTELAPPTKEAMDIPAPRSGVIRPKKPTLPPSPGSVAEFLADSLLADEDGRIEVPALFSHYRAWCRKGNIAPVPGTTFVDTLNSIRRAVGLEIEGEGDKVYCLGVRLAA